MSYCHLDPDVGINLALGFGPEPTAVMKDHIANAQCLYAEDRCRLYRDADGDGHGNQFDYITDCYSNTDGYVHKKDDCDDSDPSKWINAPCMTEGECEGNIDENCECKSTLPTYTIYRDADGDGQGYYYDFIDYRCKDLIGYVLNSDDCNDNDPEIYYGIPCDAGDGCEGIITEWCECWDSPGSNRTWWYPDNDNDGHGSTTDDWISSCLTLEGYVDNETDCNDQDPEIWIGAPCDLNGQGCPASINSACACQTTQEGKEWFIDRDNDGAGDGETQPFYGCIQPDGHVDNRGDCNDYDANIAGAGGPCVDSATGCTGVTTHSCSCNIGDCTSGEQLFTYCRDEDGDGYGNGDDCVEAESQPAGYVNNQDDCNDHDNSMYNGAPCTNSYGCEGQVDQNCDCQIAAGIELKTYYADSDADNHGDPAQSTQSCVAPANYVENANDCNDSDPLVYIGAPCSAAASSSDCGDSGVIDDTCNCIGGTMRTYYSDQDNDGYGDLNAAVETCDAAPQGYVENSLDCDDNNPSKWTGAPCSSGTACITFISPACNCSITDADNDGICDGLDVCPEGDDKIDADKYGQPGCAFETCNEQTAKFEVDILRTISTEKIASTTVTFPSPIRNPEFFIRNLGAKDQKYRENVKVNYTKASGEEVFFGEMTIGQLKVINQGIYNGTLNDWKVLIEDRDITSITVHLTNEVEESEVNTRVDLDEIKYCVDSPDESDMVLMEQQAKLRSLISALDL